MKDKVVNKLLEALFSGDKSEEDMVYVQVKFALEVLLNKSWKTSGRSSLFSGDRLMGGNRNHLSFLYMHPQICLWIAFRL